jgi:hypothetical protein
LNHGSWHRSHEWDDIVEVAITFDRKPRGLEYPRPVEIDDSALLHDRNGSQRFILASLLAHSLEHLKQRPGRDQA